MTYRIVPVDGEDDYDAEMLADLHRATFDDLYTPLVDFSEGHWWVAMVGDTAVAFAGLRPSLRFPGNCGYLWRAAVTPQHRGRGLQRRLIRVRERKAKALGWQWIFTDTTDATPSANNLISCGYRLYDPAEPYGFKNTLYWRKAL